MLKTRVLVAVIALPILVAIIALGSWAFALLVLAVLVLAEYEYTRLWHLGGYHPPELLSITLILVALGSVWFERSDWRDPALALLLIVGLLYAVWQYEKNQAHALENLALAVFGGVYLGWLGSALLAVRLLKDGIFLTLFLYGCVIVSDSAAYFVGRQFGRHKLSPRTSPKKTWEGYIGSVIGGAVFGALAVLPDFSSLSVWHGAIIGLLIGILGTVGDLGESVIKRQVGAKDSSRLIPGHGGILDRIDSVLVSAAIGYYYLIWFAT